MTRIATVLAGLAALAMASSGSAWAAADPARIAPRPVQGMLMPDAIILAVIVGLMLLEAAGIARLLQLRRRRRLRRHTGV